MGLHNDEDEAVICSCKCALSPDAAGYNLRCLPSLAMRADGSLIYGLRALLGEELGAICTFLCVMPVKSFCSENCWPLGCPGQGLSDSFWTPTSGLWGLVYSKHSTNISCYYYRFCHHYLHAAFTVLLLFTMETANRALDWMYLMCVCAAFNQPSLHSPKVLFTWMISNQTNYIFMISICTFIYEPIVSGTVQF